MEIVTKIAPLCLAIIMFGLGLGLTMGDFTRVLKNPRDFFVGFLCQVILLPIIAFILINVISLLPEIALGVMVIAAAPGGVTSNILTKFADGDVALSVSLTAIVSLLSIFIVPLIVFNSAKFLGIETVKDISMLNIAMKMFFVVTVPVIFGMIVRKLMTDFIISKTLIIQRLSVILFLIVFIGMLVGALSGLFGVGGGFLMTPLLIFLGIPPVVAVGSEAPHVLASSVSGVIAHWRKKNVDFKMGFFLLSGGIIGSTLGVNLFKLLKTYGQIDIVIQFLFIIFLVSGNPFEGTSAPPINRLGAGSIILPDGNFFSLLIISAVATKVILSISLTRLVSG